MSLQILSFLAIFGLAAASVLRQASFVDNNTVRKAGCCLPSTFQTLISTTQAIYIKETKEPKLLALLYDFAADKTAMKSAMIVTDPTANYKKLARVVQDFNNKKQYVIVDDTCNVTTLSRPWEDQCIPDSATHVGDFYFGGPDDKLECQSYLFHLPGATETFTFTKPGCIPVGSYAVLNTDQYLNSISAGYANFDTKIRTPEIFDIPDTCKHTHEPSDHMHMMGRGLPSLHKRCRH